MCGLAGFAGISSLLKRYYLTVVLGAGIDRRGGHAAGYVAVHPEPDSSPVRMARKLGTWDTAHTRFIVGAAKGELTMMHARFATCGSRDEVLHAHPFAIQRNGRSRLWGMHNGVIYDAKDSARKHGRPYTVDSKEILELLADDELESLQALGGYGVLTWIDRAQPDRVKVSRLSDDGEIVIAKIKGGGVVWASTWRILSEALECANLEAEYTIDVSEVGRVFEITKAGEVYRSEKVGVRLEIPAWNDYDYDSPTSWGDLDAAYWRTRPSYRYDKETARWIKNDDEPAPSIALRDVEEHMTASEREWEKAACEADIDDPKSPYFVRGDG